MYVKEVFDNMASVFEVKLTKHLEYSVSNLNS
jgi:predicted TPR repeat methyltransferase